jgi:DNA repair and recombination protein RAD52
MDWDAIKPELERKLDPAHVKPPSKFGPKGDYIEGWHAIAEANRIFGHGNWSYTIKALTKDSVVEGQNSKGDMQWQAAYTCIVTLTVGGATREDVGFGSGFAKQIGDAIEGATKEAVTDALKRTLRTFGNPFGLALYDKSRANVGVDAPPFDAPATRDRIKAAIAASPNVQKLNALWKHPKTCEAFEKLHPAMQAELTKAYTDRTAAVFQAPPDDEAA